MDGVYLGEIIKKCRGYVSKFLYIYTVTHFLVFAHPSFKIKQIFEICTAWYIMSTSQKI